MLPAGDILAAAVLAMSGIGWTHIDPAMPAWRDGPVPLAMQRGGSSELGAARSEQIVRAAFGAWAATPCALVDVDWRGRTEHGPDPTRADGRSVVGWIERDWVTRSGTDRTVVGITVLRWSDDGATEADMALNGEHWGWTRGSDQPRVHAGTILRHEAGHYLGLGHSDEPLSVMNATYIGEPTPLTPDDQAGVCALYPREPGLAPVPPDGGTSPVSIGLSAGGCSASGRGAAHPAWIVILALLRRTQTAKPVRTR